MQSEVSLPVNPEGQTASPTARSTSNYQFTTVTLFNQETTTTPSGTVATVKTQQGKEASTLKESKDNTFKYDGTAN
jgi:hypothetical protein